MGIKKSLRRFRSFIDKELWSIDTSGMGKTGRYLVHSIRVAVLASRTFSSQKIGFQSVALSFFCTMAVVPFVAVALAITKGIGLSDKVEAILFDYFPNNPDVIQNTMIYAENILHKATSSVLGFISAAFFVWLVIWMMLCVETVFNNVWKVKQARSFATRFWRNVAIVAIAPFLMLMLYGGAMFLTGFIRLSSLKWLIMVAGSILTFSAMYKFIPNTKVDYRNALTAAVFSGLAYTLLQFVYVESQIFLTRLSGIYGAIAAIPFFMFWLNFSWYVILVGAELSYAFQNVGEYKLEQNYESAD